MIRDNEVYKIGVLTKTHGVAGELCLSFTDDIFDRVDTDYLICRMDGILVPFFLEEYRFKSRSTALVKFEDIDTSSYVLGSLKGKIVFTDIKKQAK